MSASRIRRGSNRSSLSKRGAQVHRHLGAEPAVAEVRPVARLAVADPDDVAEAVPGHVGGEDGLGAVGEHHAGALFLVPARPHLLGGVEPRVAAQRGVDGEQAVLGHQDVGQPVAGDVDEGDVRVGPVERRERREPLQRLEGRVLGPLEEARVRAGQVDHVQVPAAGQVEQPDPGQPGAGRQVRRPVSSGPKLARAATVPSRLRDQVGGAEVALVVPGAVGGAQDPGQALAVEIGPPVAAAVQPFGQVGLAAGVQGQDGRLDLRLAVARTRAAASTGW